MRIYMIVIRALNQGYAWLFRLTYSLMGNKWVSNDMRISIITEL